MNKSAALQAITRKFRVVYLEGTVLYNDVFFLSDLLSNEGELADTELFYTLSEDIEEILEMKPTEVLTTRFKRDGAFNQALITRLK